MSIEITAIRLSGGSQHEHISDLWWRDPVAGTTGNSTRATIVTWIEGGGQAYVSASGRVVTVGVVTPTYGAKYLRTYADQTWTDNLLALPKRSAASV